MKKIVCSFMLYFIGIFCAVAAVRDTTAISRNQSGNSSNTVISRMATQNQTTVSPRTVNPTSTTSRNDSNIISRTSTNRTTVQQNNTSRSAINSSRNNTASSTARSAATNSVIRTNAVSRSATNNSTARAAVSPSRAAITTNTFGTGYNSCRDAYFTCMDQFCATANDSYRRCVCSSKLTTIQERERALSNASGQLQDFKNLNIEAINKTAKEVQAMLTASEGEQAIKEDTSSSAQTLAGISEVLSSEKSKSLSTLGTLDIAGDINQIWATTDLTSGQNIANLTGESLYNAVHAQCVELVKDSCDSTATLNMVVSAYGMYIENDCTLLLNSLDKQLQQANTTIRQTEQEMNTARLENYNAHNSTEINDCIAQVRKDITADTACGENYVHCLDITGKYLNRDTGEPIYSQQFYELGNMTSLAGDVLTNSKNSLLLSELNRKRSFAERGLDTCRDIADEVWDEFLRQAIVEIYQGQQEKIREVKNECLEVVNNCYDEQSESLKDFSNIKEELLLGSRLELSEELCREKLYTCSNLYGDPNAGGLQLLVSAMHDITDQKIEKECKSLLEEFAKDMCTVPSNDSIHSYPYACRVYAPGDQMYATNWLCNQIQSSDSVAGTDEGMSKGYFCPDLRIYDGCKEGYYLASKNEYGTWLYDGTPKQGNKCLKCPENATCNGGTSEPTGEGYTNVNDVDCGTDYAGSLYQKLVRYASQVCVRPSVTDKISANEASLPTTVLQDVNAVMDTIKVDMSKSLSAECDRLGGIWVDTKWEDTDSDGKHDKNENKLYKSFYDETGSNKNWGYCADKSSISTLSTD